MPLARVKRASKRYGGNRKHLWRNSGSATLPVATQPKPKSRSNRNVAGGGGDLHRFVWLVEKAREIAEFPAAY